METKRLALSDAGVKVGDGMRFAGYASVFGGVDSYGDTVDRKAYDATLARRDRPVQLRWNHFGPVIGKWTTLKTDAKGPWVEGELTPGHSVAEDVFASLKHGAVDGLSIGFRPVEVETLAKDRRLLKSVDLVEISVVESPADNAARITGVKAALAEVQTLADIETVLRESAGFSRADATALVSRVKALVQGKPDAARDALRQMLWRP